MGDMLIIMAAIIGALVVIFCGVAVIVMEAMRCIAVIWRKITGRSCERCEYRRRCMGEEV